MSKNNSVSALYKKAAPSIQEVLGCSGPDVLVKLFESLHCNYWIVLNDDTVICNLGHPSPIGICRVYCNVEDDPIAAHYFKFISDLCWEHEQRMNVRADRGGWGLE